MIMHESSMEGEGTVENPLIRKGWGLSTEATLQGYRNRPCSKQSKHKGVSMIKRFWKVGVAGIAFIAAIVQLIAWLKRK